MNGAVPPLSGYDSADNAATSANVDPHAADPSANTLGWIAANQQYLSASVNVVRAVLEQHLPDANDKLTAARAAFTEATRRMPATPALQTLSTTFELSPFERDTLVMCAGVELDARFAACCAEAQNDPRRTLPTFSLALAALPGAHWSALSPASPLRRFRLLDVCAGDTLTTSPLRIDERILHYLAGIQHLDERLTNLVEVVPAPADGELPPSHQVQVAKIVSTWRTASRLGRLPIILLAGSDDLSKRAIAAAACARADAGLYALAGGLLTANADERWQTRLLAREAMLTRTALLVDCEQIDPADIPRTAALTRLLEEVSGPLFLTSRERRSLPRQSIVILDIAKPTAEEQRVLWRSTLARVAEANARPHAEVGTQSGREEEGCTTAKRGISDQAIDGLVAQFDLNTAAIHSVCTCTYSHASSDAESSPDLPKALWNECRVQARSRLDHLAQRIEPVATWTDLVLPEPQSEMLREIGLHVRQRTKVYDAWGFRAKGARGLGVSALFAGPSGTGKTTAAEVLARELALDLYHIDLSQVVSKYIGETEKNLRRVFDAAEESGAILLFDEADSLFGRRSEVKDSHDRYANIEVSYLLQRIEAYRGLAVLTTNMKSALDPAFLRRIRFIVQFPFPDAAQRVAIWQHAFPPDTPTDKLEFGKLAQMNVAGGHIRNMAVAAAFLAADAGEPVRMAHVMRAARAEYAKLERPLTIAE